jgi:hypothetical protein
MVPYRFAAGKGGFLIMANQEKYTILYGRLSQGTSARENPIASRISG